MPRTVTYQIASVATGTTANAQSLPIIRAGTLIGIQWSGRFVGGAATGWLDVAVNVNNTGTNFEETNNPPREVILSRQAVVIASGSAVALNMSPLSPVSLGLRIGDTLSISQTQFGTAPATVMLVALCFVLEA